MTSVVYDANGNMLSGAGRTVTYTAFNMVAAITQGSNTYNWDYDDQHRRISGQERFYINDPVTGALSEMTADRQNTTWYNYVQAEGRIVAEIVVIAPTGTAPGPYYFVTDHLGSIAVATDSTGAVVERDAYDPWGKRRNPATGADDPACGTAPPSVASRGFTGHEHIDVVCLINENARVYDPAIGRFMTPDSMVSDAMNLQDWNAYTYVDNRPLTLTDPMGHFPLGLPGVGSVGPSFYLAPFSSDDAPDTSGMAHGGTTAVGGHSDPIMVTTTVFTVRQNIDQNGNVIDTAGVVGADGNVVDGSQQFAADLVDAFQPGEGGYLPIASTTPSRPILTPKGLTHILTFHGPGIQLRDPNQGELFPQFATPGAIKDLVNGAWNNATPAMIAQGNRLGVMVIAANRLLFDTRTRKTFPDFVGRSGYNRPAPSIITNTYVLIVKSNMEVTTLYPINPADTVNPSAP